MREDTGCNLDAVVTVPRAISDDLDVALVLRRQKAPPAGDVDA